MHRYLWWTSPIRYILDQACTADPAAGVCRPQPSPRDLLDLNLNWDKVANSPVSLAVFVTNVTDLRYYTNVTDSFNGEGFNVAGIGAPRMFGARLRYDFGH